MKSIISSLIIILLSVIFIFPIFTQAQPLVPTTCEGANCDWDDLVGLAQNIMNFLIVLSLPLAAVAFAWAGFLMMTAAGSEEKIKKAHGIFLKVGVGFLIVLTAWLIVYLITSTLLKEGYSLLKE